MDEKTKMEKTRDFIKIPMLVSIPLSILLNLVIFFDVRPENIWGDILGGLCSIALIVNAIIWIVALVKGGKILLSVLGKTLLFGFILFPIPVNFFAGFLGVIVILYAILFAPWVVLLAVMLKLRKEIKRADEYIYYNSAEVVNEE